MRNITKLKRSVRAISPVISVLLMIAIAVVASLVAYAWVMGYMNFQTQNTGQAIQIPSYAEGDTDSQMKIYVQNVGQGTVTVGEVYINDAMATIVSTDLVLAQGATKELEVTLPGTMEWTAGEQVKIKVTTTSGTFMEVAGTGSSGTSGPTGPTYTLTVNTPSNGQVAKSPDSAQYSSGTPVMLTATADTANGYVFQSWSGDVPAADQTSNPVTITMDSDKVVTANFVLTSNQGTLYPTSDAIYTYGQHYGGVYTDMQTSNNLCYTSRCYREWHSYGSYYTYDNLEYYSSFDIDDLHITENQVTKLDITLEGHYQTVAGGSITATQTLYIYNFDSNQWEQKDSASITGTTDTTRSFSITTNIGNYINSDGNIRVRVNAPDLNTEYFHYNDLFAVAVTYS